MERRHFLKLAFGFAAGGPAFQTSAFAGAAEELLFRLELAGAQQVAILQEIGGQRGIAGQFDQPLSADLFGNRHALGPGVLIAPDN